MRTIVVGTRKSELALTQARFVISELEKVCRQAQLPFRFEMKKIVTKGDKILDVMLSKVGGKGLFVKEIEQAMLSSEIDMAVHSMKDMPSELQQGLTMAAITEREDPRDCLISRDHLSIDELPQGAKIGTSSLRRACQIQAYRPDLEVQFVRGNIGTRISKIETEGFDAVILAAAGIKRVGWENKVSQYLPVEISLPAVGQGALGIECRQDDQALLQLLQQINHPSTATTVTAERTVLAELEGSCQVPIGAFAVLGNEGKEIALSGLVGTPDGKTMLKSSLKGSEPVELGKRLADQLKEQGAAEILQRFRNSDDG